MTDLKTVTRKPLTDVMAYQHNLVIDRYIKNHGGSREDAIACFAAMKQFLIVANTTAESWLTSEPIDEMWHTFLLFTRDYKVFCDEHLGNFIHHNPTEHPLAEIRAGYERVRTLARQAFGDIDERFWIGDGVACCSGCQGMGH